jgi:hypothetical protein
MLEQLLTYTEFSIVSINNLKKKTQQYMKRSYDFTYLNCNTYIDPTSIFVRSTVGFAFLTLILTAFGLTDPLYFERK